MGGSRLGIPSVLRPVLGSVGLFCLESESPRSHRGPWQVRAKQQAEAGPLEPSRAEDAAASGAPYSLLPLAALHGLATPTWGLSRPTAQHQVTTKGFCSRLGWRVVGS